LIAWYLNAESRKQHKTHILLQMLVCFSSKKKKEKKRKENSSPSNATLIE
jgi:ribosomal protein S6E (S10)